MSQGREPVLQPPGQSSPVGATVTGPLPLAGKVARPKLSGTTCSSARGLKSLCLSPWGEAMSFAVARHSSPEFRARSPSITPSERVASAVVVTAMLPAAEIRWRSAYPLEKAAESAQPRGRQLRSAFGAQRCTQSPPQCSRAFMRSIEMVGVELRRRWNQLLFICCWLVESKFECDPVVQMKSIAV